MEKHYRALVEGNLREDSGRIDQPIARSKKDRKKMAIEPRRPPVDYGLDGACARAERDAAGRPHSDRADAPNPRAHEVHRASGLRRPDLRLREGRKSSPADAARVHAVLHAPKDGGKDDVHRAAAGGICAGLRGNGVEWENNVSSRKAGNVTSCGDTISIMRTRQNGKARTDGTDEFRKQHNWIIA